MRHVVAFLFLLFASASALHRVYWTGCESVNDFIGFGITQGATYKTAARLDHAQRFAGDSSCAAFVLGASGPLNCNTPGDTLCQRKRAYFVWEGYSNYAQADTTHFSGVGFHCPCFMSLRVKHSGLVLHSHGIGQDTDWVSDITATGDSTTNFNGVATSGIDSMGHGYIENAPYTVTHGFRRNRVNDPTCQYCFKPGWNRLGYYLDAPDSAHGYAKFYINGALQDSASIRGFKGYINQAHWGLYASPAVASGSVYDDQIFMAEVDDETQALNSYDAMIAYDSIGIAH